MFYGIHDIVTLDEVQTALRTNKLTKFKDSNVHDSGEGLSVSIGSRVTRENHANSKGCDKS